MVGASLGMSANTGGEINVIPMPQSVEYGDGCFVVNDSTTLAYCEDREGDNVISLRLTADPIPGITKPEGYRMTVTPGRVEIISPSDAGLFYAMQTLSQLSENKCIPAVRIIDEPRYDYRGIMLDVSRHFFDKEFVMKQIRAMARYKLNRLHLHLTDAAGWRIEIKKYPRLTEYAAWREFPTWKEWWNNGRKYKEEGSDGAYGGYFTQDDIREIVAYAAKHHITVIPEIEMPAHSEEVLAAYPELSCTQEPYRHADFCVGNEKTFEFFEDVMDEIMHLFPSEYIHIGGDEAGKGSWKTCPRCLQRVKDEGLESTDDLQGYLINRVAAYLARHGRKAIGWDEILDGELPEESVVMSWRGTAGGVEAFSRGHKSIMTPGGYCYLDSYQDAPRTQPDAIGGYLPLEKVYSYNPSVDGESAEYESGIYGLQGNLWAEYIPTPRQMEYMLYPRALALAEVGWTLPEHKDYADFHRRALGAVEYLGGNGYNTFDLAHEVGNRSESKQPDNHLAVGMPVTYNNGSTYYPTYTAGGDGALVDGVHGGWSYNDSRWQGFYKEPGLDVTIDLGAKRRIAYVGADFMQICEPDVFMPSEVLISVSTDGEKFRNLAKIEYETVKDSGFSYKNFSWEGDASARYIRYQARKSKFGGFLFTDEIVVR